VSLVNQTAQGIFMIAVIFEVEPTLAGKSEYLDIAAELREHLQDIKGFISIERFQSLVDENKVLSLSFWQDEQAIKEWRNLIEHRRAQNKGKNELFKNYRIRVATVDRDYGMSQREQAPLDSRQLLDK